MIDTLLASQPSVEVLDEGMVKGEAVMALVREKIVERFGPNFRVSGARFGKRMENPSGYSFSIFEPKKEGKTTVQNVIARICIPARRLMNPKASVKSIVAGIIGVLKNPVLDTTKRVALKVEKTVSVKGNKKTKKTKAKKGKCTFEINNPTDRMLTCTVWPAKGFDYTGKWSKKLTLPAGDFQEVTVVSKR